MSIESFVFLVKLGIISVDIINLIYMQQGFIKTIILVVITVILILLFLAVLGAGYIWVKNPLGIKDAFLNNFKDSTTSIPVDHPLLSSDQEKTLDNLGIDVSSLPASISPEMESCFRDKLGEERVNEIISGSTPGVMDILKAQSCL